MRDLGDARASLVAWAAEQGITYSRPSERGESLACGVDRFKTGPVEESDYTKWETELALLILDG